MSSRLMQQSLSRQFNINIVANNALCIKTPKDITFLPWILYAKQYFTSRVVYQTVGGNLLDFGLKT